MKFARLLSAILAFMLISGCAAVAEGDVVVVSLGDSYASGEGIEPFYGQDKPLSEKVLDQNWLAHRSEKSWAGLLRVPGIEGPLNENRGEYIRNADGSYTLLQAGSWFFVAASGAKCCDLFKEQRKYVSRRENGVTVDRTFALYPQLYIFDALAADGRKADYVTLTLGGNDMGFANIIAAALVNGPLLSGAGEDILGEYADIDLYTLLDTLWESFHAEGGQKQTIKAAYRAIAEAAGDQATIIVAGYPTFLGESENSFIFSNEDVKYINESTRRFNSEIETITRELCQEGYNICFVSVESEFAGKEAYSGARDEMINRVSLGAKAQDLVQDSLVSSYIIHPNARGAEAYARCIQQKIDELEQAKGK